MARQVSFLVLTFAARNAAGNDLLEEQGDNPLGLTLTSRYGSTSRSWDSPLAQAADAEFDRYVAEHRLAETMTPKELDRYKERYFGSAKKQARSMDVSGSKEDQAEQHKKWERSLSDSLAQELPAVTEHLVQKVNLISKGWTANASDWSEDLTVKDAGALMGFVHEPEIENTTLDHFPEEFRRLIDFPASFDSREQWPHCRETIDHVRDQGKCGSCWAMAAAGSMDGRLCIASNGKFSGPDAWTSAGYIASCYNMVIINGCQGGNPAWALSRAKQSFIPFLGGVPTGSEADDTCVPYFGSGDALQHFDGQNQLAPSCPSKCTSKSRYPRSLSRDRFFTAGTVTTTPDVSHAKRALMQGGSIPMAFTVFQDFMAYTSGYYDRTTNKQMGGHATTLIGWENHNGADYLLSLNSWGRKWGENGAFKMKESCCGVQYFVADVATQKGFPLPKGPKVAISHASATTSTPHRRRFLREFFGMSRAADIPSRYADMPPAAMDFPSENRTAIEDSDSNLPLFGLDVDEVAVKLDRVRVVIDITNVSCDGSTTSNKVTALEQAVAMAVVGKLDRLIPGAIVEDLAGRPSRVSALACSAASGCKDQAMSANATSIAFFIVQPAENVSQVEAVLKGDPNFLTDVEWRIDQASIVDAGKPQAAWLCFASAAPTDVPLIGHDFTLWSHQSWFLLLIVVFSLTLIVVLSAAFISGRRANKGASKRKVALDEEATSPASADEKPLMSIIEAGDQFAPAACQAPVLIASQPGYDQQLLTRQLLFPANAQQHVGVMPPVATVPQPMRVVYR